MERGQGGLHGPGVGRNAAWNVQGPGRETRRHQHVSQSLQPKRVHINCKMWISNNKCEDLYHIRTHGCRSYAIYQKWNGGLERSGTAFGNISCQSSLTIWNNGKTRYPYEIRTMP